MRNIQAVCFDAFETLVEMRDRRDPFRPLLLRNQSHRWVDPYRRAVTLGALAAEVGLAGDEFALAKSESDLAAECASILPAPEGWKAWADVRRANLRIAVCCNLMLPHAEAILACLPGIPEALVFSFEVGMLEPEPEFYGIVCCQLALPAEEILFVSDCKVCSAAAGSTGMPSVALSELDVALASGNVGRSAFGDQRKPAL